MAKEKKQFRELSEEELEKVTGGGNNCWADDVDLCQIAHGVWNRIDCTCTEPIDFS